jgi:hypothetical protein
MTALWSGHPTDIAVKMLHISVMLGMLACFRGSSVFLRTIGAASTVASVFIPAYVIGSGHPWVDTRTWLPLLALAISVHVSKRPGWSTGPLLMAAALTTLRAAILGAAAGVSVAWIRSWWGRAVLVGAILCGSVAWMGTSDAEYRPPRTAEVSRQDVVGRLETVEEDGASHRFELWQAIAQDALRRDPMSWELLVGWGLGDVNYHIADVFPDIADYRNEEPTASSHNTLIELILIGGLGMVPLVLWMIVDAVRFARLSDMTLSIVVIAAFAAGANELLMDLGGGSALLALTFGTLTAPALERPKPRPNEARSTSNVAGYVRAITSRLVNKRVSVDTPQ